MRRRPFLVTAAVDHSWIVSWLTQPWRFFNGIFVCRRACLSGHLMPTIRQEPLTSCPDKLKTVIREELRCFFLDISFTNNCPRTTSCSLFALCPAQRLRKQSYRQNTFILLFKSVFIPKLNIQTYYKTLQSVNCRHSIMKLQAALMYSCS